MEYSFKDKIFNPCQWLRREAPCLNLRGVLRSANECGYASLKQRIVYHCEAVWQQAPYMKLKTRQICLYEQLCEEDFVFNEPMSKTFYITEPMLGKYLKQ